MPPPLPILQTQLAPGVIDLGLGNPPLSLLPLEMIRSAAQRALSQNDNSFLQYGAEQGDGYFRLALAEFLSKGYGFQVAPENLFTTTGISNGLDLLCTLFTEAGDTICVEEPSYFLALKIFADHRLRVVPIETDEEGLIIESLEEKLTRYRPRFLYTIPVHQNPSGRTLTETRRARLIELSRQFDFLVLADEVYQLLNYSGEPPKSFGAYSYIENIISLGSFSKILAPGLRLGWIQTHANIIKRLVTSGLLDSGGGLNPFTSAIIREVIESGDLERNVDELIETYRPRVALIDSLLREHLPAVTYSVPRGGYFFWVRLPEEMDAAELRNKAKVVKVDIRHGALFSSQNGLKNYMRLCFVFHEEKEIEEGIVRLKGCMEGNF
ncbi:MAG: PLP-dependent aminotransferase family protein [Anaerolineales bacterium]|nr:PLP-dependent aminotransferase family protein [Anaerolineales bacterium]NUQ84715.1 PLP-dependent aminotransferase family protein [Anaerolineales bacterium]